MPTTRTINGKALNADITLGASDVGADPAGSAASAAAAASAAQNTANSKISTSEKGVAGGVATLGTDGKVPSGQLPAISSSATYTGTIGTSWTENADTGEKTQNVAISGILANDNGVIVDHVRGSESLEDFVEAENQYLDCITNGYAETYAGGIKFTIFGDANTVSIPIIVKVVR